MISDTINPSLNTDKSVIGHLSISGARPRDVPFVSIALSETLFLKDVASLNS